MGSAKWKFFTLKVNKHKIHRKKGVVVTHPELWLPFVFYYQDLSQDEAHSFQGRRLSNGVVILKRSGRFATSLLGLTLTT